MKGQNLCMGCAVAASRTPHSKSPPKYGKVPTAMRNARKPQSWLQEVRKNKLHATYEKL